MAFQPVPDTAEVVLNYTLNNLPVTNILHARFLAGTPTEPDMQDLADEVYTWADGDWMERQAPQCTLVNVTVRGLTAAVDNQAVSAGVAIVGTGSGMTSPNNVTKAFTLRSGLTGRSARGRIYVPSIPDNYFETDDNYLTAAYLDAQVTTLDDLIGIMAGIGWEWVVVSREQAGVVLANGVTYAITSVGYSNTTTDSMRSRLPKG